MTAKTNENTVSLCTQCTTEIARGEDCITCEGFCHNAFHSGCVNLNSDALRMCRMKLNIWWICDSCTDSMRSLRNDRISRNEEFTTVSDAVDDPKKERAPAECSIEHKCEDAVRGVMEEMLMIKQQISDIQRSMDRTVPPRESLFESSLCTSSSPLSSTKLLQGSGRDRVDLSCDTDIGDRFWLFFTKIKNTTTEKQIHEMVSTALGERSSSGPIIVKKLVPFWRDPTSMQYVSFKVGVDPALKYAAMKPSTWPAGVCYRQFFSNGRY